ncbi:unnamed protein product [Paramecium octaurelia]|uniref:Uncharacterized protein n=1 Tax=Paramecium octaurelia TaxID=43137 RepID=A0A8S1W1I0_PAROT|nr:unnamed protein product [Paramecium octaurelia]
MIILRIQTIQYNLTIIDYCNQKLQFSLKIGHILIKVQKISEKDGQSNSQQRDYS